MIPLNRMREYLKSKKLWDDSKQAELQERAEETVADAVKRAETIEAPEVSDIFNWTFAEIPEQIAKQRDTMRTSSIGQDPAQIASEQTTTA